MVPKSIENEKITAFLAQVRAIENNDFKERAQERCRFIHSTLGLVTESAELKALLDWHLEDPPVEDFDLKFTAEVGDTIFYLLQGMDAAPPIYAETPIDFAHGTPSDRLIYAVGEVADILKRYLSYNMEIPYARLNMWYLNIWTCLGQIASDFDLNLDICIAVTMAKLNLRYPTGDFRYADRKARDRFEEKRIMRSALMEALENDRAES
jgi:hypothetical protein